MLLVHNEQTKLTAAWLNTLATALVAAGTFAPFAASNPATNGVFFAVAAGVCFGGGMGLHVSGRAVLRRLRE
jgi:hypothetical protein